MRGVGFEPTKALSQQLLKLSRLAASVSPQPFEKRLIKNVQVGHSLREVPRTSPFCSRKVGVGYKYVAVGSFITDFSWLFSMELSEKVRLLE